jgi:hypothetical protein
VVAALNRQFAVAAQLWTLATAVMATHLADCDRLTIGDAGQPSPPYCYRADESGRSIASGLGVRAGKAANRRAANRPLGLGEAIPKVEVALVLVRGGVIPA